MSDSDIAAKFDLDLPFVHAIRDTESGGNVHAVRFEPHIFHRDRPLSPIAVSDIAWSHHDHHSGADILSHADPAELAIAPYTPGHDRAASDVRAETDRGAMERAWKISPPRACRATSYGAFQVLGWALLIGAASPDAALNMFDSAPASVSDVLLERWLDAHPLAVAAARAKNIPEWVRIYNGADINSPHGAGRAAKYIARMRASLNVASWPARG